MRSFPPEKEDREHWCFCVVDGGFGLLMVDSVLLMVDLGLLTADLVLLMANSRFVYVFFFALDVLGLYVF